MTNVLNFKEAMAILRIGRNATLSLFNSESFPSYKVGNKWFITADSLDKWIKEQVKRKSA